MGGSHWIDCGSGAAITLRGVSDTSRGTVVDSVEERRATGEATSNLAFHVARSFLQSHYSSALARNKRESQKEDRNTPSSFLDDEEWYDALERSRQLVDSFPHTCLSLSEDR